QSTRVAIVLDTDANAATGINQGNGLGADYALDLVATTGQATITRADVPSCAAHGSCFDPIGAVSMRMSTDRLQVDVALSAIGSADGRLAFQAHSYVLVAPLTAITFDFLPVGRVQ